MSEKVDRRVRKTKAQLRAGLARLMQKKSIKEITVKELVEEVDINRSTFYLHYTDIYEMLATIENEFMEEIAQALHEFPIDPMDEDCSRTLIGQLFSILHNNRDICLALLGPNGDMVFVEKMENFIEDNIFSQISEKFPPNDHRDIAYAYAFCLNGCIGMIRSWLSSPQQESVEHMANLTYMLIGDTTHHLLQSVVGTK